MRKRVALVTPKLLTLVIPWYDLVVMEGEKSQKFSVSFPANLLVAMDDFIGARPRSQYLQELVECNLKQAGVSVENGGDLKLRIMAAAEELGADRALEILTGAARQTAGLPG